MKVVRPETAPPARLLQLLAVASTILLVLVLRRTDSLLNPQFFAEDGGVFYAQALAAGPASIFAPNAGCLWVLPRIMAVLISLLPVVWAPFAFNLAALIVDALCCALFSLPAWRHLVRSDRLRIGSCLLFAAALPASSDLIGTLTNMPWYLALAAMGVIALQSEMVARMRIRDVVLIAAGALLCATSSPVVITAAPLALWQAQGAVRNRNGKMLAVQSALLAGILIQALVSFTMLGAAGPSAPAQLLPNLPLAYLFPGFLRCILGDNLAKPLAEHHFWATAAGASFLIAAWLVLLWRRLRPTLLLSALVAIVCPVAMAVAFRQVVWANWSGVASWAGHRYLLLPVCAFIFLMAAWINTFPRFRFPLIALCLPFALGTAGNFRTPPFPDFDWPSHASLVRQWLWTGCEAAIPVPPGLPWSVHLPNLAPPGDRNCLSLGGFRVKLSVRPVDRAQVGPVIPVSAWQADPAWTRDGFHPSVGTLSGEVLYGSYSGSDRNRGVLTSAPFSTGSGCIVLPIAHGPSTGGQYVSLIAAAYNENLGDVPLDEVDGHWKYWAVNFRQDVGTLRIVAEDRGDQFGEWLAIGEPHTCR